MCPPLSQQHYTSQDLFQVEKGDKRILRVRCLPLKVVVEVALICRIENALQSKTSSENGDRRLKVVAEKRPWMLEGL